MAKKGSILITGAAKRVGRIIALSLADEGYNIALHYNHSESEARTVQKEIQSKNVECEIFQADLRDLKATKSMFEASYKAFPDLNVLINNASVFERTAFLDTNEEFFDDNLSINFKAAFFLSQYFAKICKKGNIINISDVHVTKNTTSYFAYLLSKKAFSEFTKMAAKELAPEIMVNQICPGTIIATPNETSGYMAEKAKKMPAQKLSNPEELARVVKFILESNSFYGQSFFLDGGESLL
jgi:NAD(P)-dependent dehydrogenase (short-subunit alcohol dehydrogenase family)